jgi:uncharacterized OB-fold protein/acyl dehydratase
VTQTETQSLIERLQVFVSKPYGGPSVGRDPVNVPMIRHLTDALGDRNPVYTDEDFAKGSVHGGIVAPATSLQVWTMTGLVARATSDDAENPQSRLMSMVEAEGYIGVVATNCEQTYHRYLRPGDLLTVTSEVESITGPKKTGLGEGYFITTLQTYRDQAGEIVGEMRFRILKFRPQVQEPKQEIATQTEPAPIDSAFFWEGIETDELRIQRCGSCGTLRHPPRPMCPSCRSLERDHVAASGRGTVYSFVVHHKPAVPGREHPFAVVLVELEEGTRIVGNVVDCGPSDVKIGMDVEVTFETNGSGRKLPLWRPV